MKYLHSLYYNIIPINVMNFLYKFQSASPVKASSTYLILNGENDYKKCEMDIKRFALNCMRFQIGNVKTD